MCCPISCSLFILHAHNEILEFRTQFQLEYFSLLVLVYESQRWLYIQEVHCMDEFVSMYCILCRFDFCVTNISFIVDIIQMFHPEVAFLIPIRFIRYVQYVRMCLCNWGESERVPHQQIEQWSVHKNLDEKHINGKSIVHSQKFTFKMDNLQIPPHKAGMCIHHTNNV